jgi:hypothetical protein
LLPIARYNLACMCNYPETAFYSFLPYRSGDRLFLSISKSPCSIHAVAISLRLPPVCIALLRPSPVRRRLRHPVVCRRPASCCRASVRPFVLELCATAAYLSKHLMMSSRVSFRSRWSALNTTLDDIGETKELDTTTEGPPTELFMSK